MPPSPPRFLPATVISCLDHCHSVVTTFLQTFGHPSNLLSPQQTAITEPHKSDGVTTHSKPYDDLALCVPMEANSPMRLIKVKFIKNKIMTTSQLVSWLPALLHSPYKSQRECSTICLLWGQCPTPTLCLTISGCHAAWLTLLADPYPLSDILLHASLSCPSLTAPCSCLCILLAPPYFHVCSSPSSPFPYSSCKNLG